MSESTLVALISGIFSLLSALGAVFLKDYLDGRRLRTPAIAPPKPGPGTIATDELLPPPRPPGLRFLRRPVEIVVASFALGVVTRALRPMLEVDGIHYESLGAWALLVIGVVGLAVHHRKNGWQLPYQLENLALWTGYASGWSLVHGGVWGDLLGVTIPWWMGCAIVGGLIVSIRRSPVGHALDT